MGENYVKRMPKNLGETSCMVYALNLIIMSWSLIRLRLAQGWSEARIVLELGVCREEVSAARDIFVNGEKGRRAEDILEEVCRNLAWQVYCPELDRSYTTGIVHDWVWRVRSTLPYLETCSFSDLFPE